MKKAVVFDVDGVMIDSFNANFHFYEKLFKQEGYPWISIEEYVDFFPRSMMDVVRAITKSDSEEEIQRIWEAGRNRDLYPYDLLQSPEGLTEAIEELAGKYLLAVATSRIRGAVFVLPQLMPLEKYFSTAVYYEDTEKHKPDPAPLLLTARRLDLNPKDVVYIGDAQSDMDSASAAGTEAILYKKENSLKARNWTNNFAELPKLIEKLWM